MIGFYQLRPGREPDAAFLNYLGVSPAYRGGGLGSRLLKAAEEHATGAGFDRMQLDVLNENAGAIRFYERHGYERCYEHVHDGRAKARYEKRIDGGAVPRRAGQSFGSEPAKIAPFARRLIYGLLVQLPNALGRVRQG